MQENKHLKYTITIKKADLIVFLEGILLEIRRGLSYDFYLFPIVNFNNFFLFRQGSGSACRSMYGGFVAWEKGEKKDGSDSIAKQVTNNNCLQRNLTLSIYSRACLAAFCKPNLI